MKKTRKMHSMICGLLVVAAMAAVAVHAQSVGGRDSAELVRIQGFVERYVQGLPTMTAGDVDRYLGGSYARDQRKLLRNPAARQVRQRRLDASTVGATVRVYPYGAGRYLASVQGVGWNTIYVVTTDAGGGIRIVGEIERHLVCSGTPRVELSELCK